MNKTMTNIKILIQKDGKEVLSASTEFDDWKGDPTIVMALLYTAKEILESEGANSEDMATIMLKVIEEDLQEANE
tara:strand:+ start:10439 stop:10663 length:225 start_codon:yes stop_codon:yes gene_type:complete